MRSAIVKAALLGIGLLALLIGLYSYGTVGQRAKSAEDEVKYLIGVSQPNLVEPWRVMMNEEIKREVEKHADLRVIFTDAANDSRQQADDVRKLMGYGIDLLIISLDDPVMLTPIVTDTFRNIPVIVLGRGVTGYDYTLYIGTDNRLIGSKAGEYAKQLLDNGSGKRIIEIKGLQGAPTVEERSAGFHEALADREDIRIAASIYADWQRDKSEDELNELLADHADVDLIFAHNDAMALGASKALAHHRISGVTIIGVDGVNSDNGGLQLVKNGVLTGTFTSPTGGGEAIQYAVDILNEEKGIPKKVILRSHQITADNAESFERKTAVSEVKPRRGITDHRPIRIGFAQVGTESGWRLAHTKSVISAAKEEGIELLFEDADQQQEKQIEYIRKFIAERVDIIVFSPVIKTGWDEVLREAKEAGIPVILSDREVKVSDDSLWTAYIGSDFTEEGRRAARWLVQELADAEGGVNIVELQGTKDSGPMAGRKQGFEDIIAQDGKYRIVDSLQGDFTFISGKELMHEALKKHGSNIHVVYAHNDDMALGAIEAIEHAGLRPGKDILVISIDATKAALKALAAGKMNFVVECTPLLGPQLMKAVKDYMAGKELPMKIITSEGVFTQETAKRELANREY
ncbi:HTH-type transcriptional repressor PurR [Paenibacillus sp. CECT 9249]|uniref:substrate-binding domain-containing protein n=1 Tax=Paenibacillus sp. CECT 9249 TaxID=2845385 RepID=UPI001E52AF9F|nr:substrate-binding domain-containing protein [Paenibacillus sp. CECT 9249]CAH0120288.1 HTH-type transcriptional repressor PurR [Paenibacillus sp. CECT 9249]